MWPAGPVPTVRMASVYDEAVPRVAGAHRGVNLAVVKLCNAGLIQTTSDARHESKVSCLHRVDSIVPMLTARMQSLQKK